MLGNLASFFLSRGNMSFEIGKFYKIKYIDGYTIVGEYIKFKNGFYVFSKNNVTIPVRKEFLVKAEEVKKEEADESPRDTKK